MVRPSTIAGLTAPFNRPYPSRVLPDDRRGLSRRNVLSAGFTAAALVSAAKVLPHLPRFMAPGADAVVAGSMPPACHPAYFRPRKGAGMAASA